MTEPKVEFKNIKTFLGMEGMGGVNAKVYINGIYCMYLIDSDDGGCLDLDMERTPEAQANVQLLKDYIETMPVEPQYKLKYDLDLYLNMKISDILNQKEIEKAEKRFNKALLKLSESSVIFGTPNAREYRYYNFKRPLSTIPLVFLQNHVDRVRKDYCTNGVQILNTNLEALGVK
jgi:hypothetical protein